MPACSKLKKLPKKIRSRTNTATAAGYRATPKYAGTARCNGADDGRDDSVVTAETVDDRRTDERKNNKWRPATGSVGLYAVGYCGFGCGVREIFSGFSVAFRRAARFDRAPLARSNGRPPDGLQPDITPDGHLESITKRRVPNPHAAVTTGDNENRASTENTSLFARAVVVHRCCCTVACARVYDRRCMLTAEYDGRCRAHDAEERRVNRVFSRGGGGGTHFFYHNLITTLTIINTNRPSAVCKSLKRKTTDGREWRTRRRRKRRAAAADDDDGNDDVRTDSRARGK